MVTKQTVSRLLLVKLFVLIFLWTSFSITPTEMKNETKSNLKNKY